MGQQLFSTAGSLFRLSPYGPHWLHWLLCLLFLTIMCHISLQYSCLHIKQRLWSSKDLLITTGLWVFHWSLKEHRSPSLLLFCSRSSKISCSSCHGPPLLHSRMRGLMEANFTLWQLFRLIGFLAWRLTLSCPKWQQILFHPCGCCLCHFR